MALTLKYRSLLVDIRYMVTRRVSEDLQLISLLPRRVTNALAITPLRR